MVAADTPGKFILQRSEWRVENLAPTNDHIVRAQRHVIGCVNTNRFAQPTANTISFDCVAGLLGHCNAKARRIVVTAPQQFKQEQPSPQLLAALNGQEFGALRQTPRLPPLRSARQHSRPRAGISSRQPLAAAGPAGGDHATAALGGHACAKAMAALANEFRGLIGALHLFKYRGVRPFFILSITNRSIQDRSKTHDCAPGGRPERAGLI